MTASDLLLRLLSVILLITINAFFVTAEFSMVSVRRSRISQLVEEGDIQAQTVQSLQRSIERLLSTTQLGITLSSLALGWIGESTMAVLVKNLIVSFPLPREIITYIAHSFALPLAFFLTVYLQIVLGELLPKSVALLYSEQLARFLGHPIATIARLFKPFIFILNESTRFLLRLGGINYTGQRLQNRVTLQELRLIINTERESTGLEANQREIIENVFEFVDVSAVEVMVPRTRIKAIAIDSTLKDVITQVSITGHSRYPVMRESIDDIIGIIEFKDLALSLAQESLTRNTPIETWVKPAQLVPESTRLSELLHLMQRSQLKMVMVIDEFGGTSGLITLKDLIAEIIGSQNEGSSSQEVALQFIDEDSFLVQAQMSLEQVNHVLNLNLPITDEYQTLGGFVLYLFQKIPNQGESINYENLELTIEKSSGPRLSQIRINRLNNEDLSNYNLVQVANPIDTLSPNKDTQTTKPQIIASNEVEN